MVIISVKTWQQYVQKCVQQVGSLFQMPMLQVIYQRLAVAVVVAVLMVVKVAVLMVVKVAVLMVVKVAVLNT
jgi:hypothetical protein